MPCIPQTDALDGELSDDEHEWLLGFVDEPQKPTDLLRHKFPSKVGGRPAWLNPHDLPTPQQLTCRVTGKQLDFLLQVYAAVDDKPHAFHRSIFVFVSPEGSKLASAGAVRAFRCQLPRRNPFYAYEPPSDADNAPPPLQGADAERVKACDPWKVAEAEVAVASGTTAPAPAGVHLYPELELIVEPEADGHVDDDAEDMRRLLDDYQERVVLEGELSEDELPSEVVSQVADNLTAEQRHFANFQTRISAAPGQCLRYCFEDGANPLWPSLTNVPLPTQIPPCNKCGKPRKFEFQVLPQLLNHLDLDDEDPNALDWGTIAVYSCSASCSLEDAAASQDDSAYVEEFVWVQPS